MKKYFVLPEVSFAPADIESFIDEVTFGIHYKSIHEKLRRQLEELVGEDEDNLNQDLIEFQEVAGFQDPEMRHAAGGHFNHAFFWHCISKKKGSEPSGKLKEAIERDFTDFETLKE